jgi:hypothetical protein
MTVEHVLPRWIGEELQVTGGVETRKGPGGDPLYGSNELSVELRKVCGTCNSGWMASLEGKARPILAPMMRNDGPTLLSADDLALIGVWATKTALLMELATASLRGPAYAPPSHFHSIFGQPHRPPAGVQVWLLAVNAHPERRLATSFGGWMEDTNHQPTGYFHTFHVGGLGFQVLGQTLDGRTADLPQLTVPPPVRPFLLDAWPIDSATAWPPEGIVMELEHLRILAGWPGRLIGQAPV